MKRIPLKVPGIAAARTTLPKISEQVLARARTKVTAGRSGLDATVDIFAAYRPAPGVLPPNYDMALDSSIQDTLSWAAQNVIQSTIAEGQAFLGYPFLSELAQRPEYRCISETIATEMTRKWIKIQSKSEGDTDQTDRIKKIEAEFERLHVREMFCKDAEQDGFFGRSHLYLDTGDTNNPDELKKPIGDGKNSRSRAKVSKSKPLVALRTVEPVWCYPTNYNSSNPLRDDWYKPKGWFAQGQEVDGSRLLTFIGREVPDILKPAYSFGGLPLSQMAMPYVQNWLKVRQSVTDIISAFSVFVLGTNMSSLLDVGGEELFKRAQLFNLLRDNRGLFMIDKDTEEFSNVSAPLGTLDHLQAQAQEHMAAVSRIPLVKLLGITPSGLNASSDGEIRTFYDSILAYQQRFFRPNLTTVFNFVQLSLWGKVDDTLTFEFEPLWSLDEKSLADKRKVEADTDIELINAGVLDPSESRNRLANDPDSPYDSLDPDELPDLAEEEEEGLDPTKIKRGEVAA